MSEHYILGGSRPNGRDAVPCDDLHAWAQWFENANRTVAKTSAGGVKVSTVFLAIDHQFGDGPPLLFETMVFGIPFDKEILVRYSTWEQAEAGHKAVCRKVFTCKRT